MHKALGLISPVPREPDIVVHNCNTWLLGYLGGGHKRVRMSSEPLTTWWVLGYLGLHVTLSHIVKNEDIVVGVGVHMSSMYSGFQYSSTHTHWRYETLCLGWDGIQGKKNEEKRNVLQGNIHKCCYFISLEEPKSCMHGSRGSLFWDRVSLNFPGSSWTYNSPEPPSGWNYRPVP